MLEVAFSAIYSISHFIPARGIGNYLLPIRQSVKIVAKVSFKTGLEESTSSSDTYYSSDVATEVQPRSCDCHLSFANAGSDSHKDS